jgi:hypothetical protein
MHLLLHSICVCCSNNTDGCISDGCTACAQVLQQVKPLLMHPLQPLCGLAMAALAGFGFHRTLLRPATTTALRMLSTVRLQHTCEGAMLRVHIMLLCAAAERSRLRCGRV